MKKFLFSALSILTTSSGIAKINDHPNVILLVADDLGYGDLSCYGAKSINTPAIDNLANTGVRFTNAHACAATSTPSRYSLLTGEYCHKNPNSNVANGDASMIIKPEQFTLADLFKNNEYKTAAIGKWHLGLGSTSGQQDWNNKLDLTPADIGFDYSYIMAATADRVPCVWIENDRVANFDPSSPIEISYSENFDTEPTLYDYEGNLLLQSSHGHDQSVVNGIGRIGFMRGGGKAVWKDESIADSIVKKTVEFINQNQENPFFIYLCTNDIHVPRWPAERFRGKSEMGLRGDAILQLDWTVEVITKTLENLGLRENTLIILTSDNGPILDDGYHDNAEQLLGDHLPAGNNRGTKYSAYNGGSKVPFIVSWPTHTPKGKVSNALLSQIDCIASFAKLLNTTLPQDVAIDSRNFLKTWLGVSNQSTPFAISMAQNRTLNIRTKKWKYIEPSNDSALLPWNPKVETGYKNVPQLFNLKRDIGEQTNIAKKHRFLVSYFQKIIDKVRD